MSDSPLVSIIIPIRDRASLFAAAMQSLREQTYPDWEAIVVDDGSSPDEFQSITNLVATDRRARLVQNSSRHSGACAARNIGIKAARGDYFIFLDADDALAAGCLAHRLAIISKEPALDFVAFPSWYFHHQTGDSTALWNVFNADDDLARLLAGDSPWQTTGPIWRRAALERLGPWDERLRGWQDTEFHLRALISGLAYRKISEPDAFWRAPGQAGSIGSLSQKPLHAVNRIRMLGRVGTQLRDAGKLSPRYRRILATQFYQHAFRIRLARRHALAIWRQGRRLGLVTQREYWTGLFLDALERGSRRFSRKSIHRLFPDLERPLRFGTVHHPIDVRDAGSRQSE
jgi:glycosyltransferase involved in cell wall biosynthesis